MRLLINCTIAFLILAGGGIDAALAQGADGKKTQVMVLGVYHFANPNRDQVKSSFPDHLSDKKQAEIVAVLDLLARFHPTKIVVEAIPENEKIKANYLEYLKGTYRLEANEINQIGYRLGKRFDLKQIYSADYQLGLDFSPVFGAANETKNIRFLEGFQKTIGEIQAQQKSFETKTVLQALVELNEPVFQDKTRDFYLQLARVRSKDKFEGADALTAWYQRNFHIFSNLVHVIESTDDRVLVIFGQGHAPYLRELVKSCRDMQLVEPNVYLKPR